MLGIFADNSQRDQVLWNLSLLPRTQSPSIHSLLSPRGEECCLLSGQCPDVRLEMLGSKGKVGDIYLMTVKATNEIYVAKYSKVENKAVYSKEPPRYLNTKDTDCFPIPSLPITYLGLDEFTNETIVAYIINSVSLSAGHNFTLKYYRSFICGSQGVTITEYCDLGDLTQFPKNPWVLTQPGMTEIIILNNKNKIRTLSERTIDQILMQVFQAFNFLSQNLGFISGDLKAANIFVKSEPIKDAPFTCKISDYGKSSCLLPIGKDGQVEMVMRIYNNVSYANIYSLGGAFEPQIDQSSRYIVDDFFLVNTYADLRHMGSPYYRTFDIYTFIVSLLTIPSYYYRFFTSSYLVSRYWKLFWVNEEEENIVKERIDEYIRKGTATGIGEAIGILKGISLSCSILGYIIGG